ncbi:MAG TPA: alpha/beta fold hydrolase [Actinomycetota bacterium]|nr:alpha/beta fold hydrolase [Actinomycetota bacterium]
MPELAADGTKINYTDSGGSGTPVLLLHAFPLSAAMWEPQVESLGDRFRFIAPDLSGFGTSDVPDEGYSMERWAGEVRALLDELGLDKVVLAGLSMGGYLAFECLRRFPERFSALVLADTKAEADPPEGVEKRTTQQGMVRDGKRDELIGALVGALLGDATTSKKPDVVEKVRGLMDNPPAGFIGALEAMKNRPDSTGELAAVKVPTLIIVGENDAVTPPEASRKMHEHIGGSRLVVIPEAGHLSSLEAPEAFNGALAEFLGGL